MDTAATKLYLHLKENAVQASLIDANTDEKESSEEVNEEQKDEAKSETEV